MDQELEICVVVPEGCVQPAPVAAAGLSCGTGPCSLHKSLCCLSAVQDPAPSLSGCGGKSKYSCTSPSTPGRGGFNPPPIKLHWDLTPWVTGRRQAWPSSSSPSTLRSCSPDLLPPSPLSLDRPVVRHGWLLPRSTRHRDAVGGEGPRDPALGWTQCQTPIWQSSCSQLGQMWAPACDSAVWCLPLSCNGSNGKPVLHSKGGAPPEGLHLPQVLLARLGGDLCPCIPSVFMGSAVIPGGEAAQRRAGYTPQVLLGV